MRFRGRVQPAVGSAAVCWVGLARRSVDAGGALPIEYVYEFPSVLIELDLELAFFVEGQLAGRI